MKVLNIDILAGSPEAKAPPRYSVALLENGKLVLRDEVTAYKLWRLIKDLNPEAVSDK